MSTDPLNRYQAMMNGAHAPDDLPDRVLAAARSRMADASRSAETGDGQACSGTPAPQQAPSPSAPAFTVKRTRFKGFAIAACTVLALGLGVTALAAGPLASAGGGNAPAAANSFQLLAFADENAKPANGPVTLNSEDFLLSRSSVGPVYDSETDSYPGPVEASRAYNLDLTCVGDNIASITYELQGEGVSFNNWQLTSEYLESNGELPAGSVVANVDQNSTFTVDYDNQDMSAPGGVHHELYFNYTLNEAEKAVWDEFHAKTSQPRVPRESMTEEEVATWTEETDKLELVLGQHDAKIISQAKLVLTATFADGTTATKTYRLAPVDNFNEAYTGYLATRFSTDGTAKPASPALYTLEELA